MELFLKPRFIKFVTHPLLRLQLLMPALTQYLYLIKRIRQQFQLADKPIITLILGNEIQIQGKR